MKIKQILSRYLNNFIIGDKRSINLKLNVVYSFFLQFVSIATSLALVPLTIDLVSPEGYGLWLTVTSIVGWFTLFDLGLGTGLKNKLSEAIALERFDRARMLVSTTYFFLVLIVFVLGLVYFFISKFIDWQLVLNVKKIDNQSLKRVMDIVVYSFFFRFVFQTINIVLTSFQKPAQARLLNTLGNVLILLVIYLFVKFKLNTSLETISTIFSVLPILIFFFMTLFLFFGKYKKISPSLNHIDTKEGFSLFSLGIKFFLIQISAIVLFSSGNFLVLQLYGAESVPIYNLAHKLFSLLSIFFDILIAPFWVAYIDAWAKNEISWIKKSTKKLLLIWMLSTLAGIIMLLFSKQIYHMWIGERLSVPFNVSLFCFIYFALFTFGGIYNVFINALGKVKLQLICLAISMFIFIPLVYYFVNFLHLGLYSIFLALIVSNFYSIIIAPIQYYKIINGKAKGLFNQ